MVFKKILAGVVVGALAISSLTFVAFAEDANNESGESDNSIIIEDFGDESKTHEFTKEELALIATEGTTITVTYNSPKGWEDIGFGFSVPDGWADAAFAATAGEGETKITTEELIKKLAIKTYDENWNVTGSEDVDSLEGVTGGKIEGYNGTTFTKVVITPAPSENSGETDNSVIIEDFGDESKTHEFTKEELALIAAEGTTITVTYNSPKGWEDIGFGFSVPDGWADAAFAATAGEGETKITTEELIKKLAIKTYDENWNVIDSKDVDSLEGVTGGKIEGYNGTTFTKVVITPAGENPGTSEEPEIEGIPDDYDLLDSGSGTHTFEKNQWGPGADTTVVQLFDSDYEFEEDDYIIFSVTPITRSDVSEWTAAFQCSNTSDGSEWVGLKAEKGELTIGAYVKDIVELNAPTVTMDNLNKILLQVWDVDIDDQVSYAWAIARASTGGAPEVTTPVEDNTPTQAPSYIVTAIPESTTTAADTSAPSAETTTTTTQAPAPADNNGAGAGTDGSNGAATGSEGNPATGVVFAVIPALAAAAGVMISKKRK